jgi:hypothetical protein
LGREGQAGGITLNKKTADLYDKILKLLAPLEKQLNEKEYKKAISPVLAWYNSECARKAQEIGVKFDFSSYKGTEGVLMALEQEKDFLKTLKKKIEQLVNEYKEKK